LEELLVFLPFLAPVIVANLAERHRHAPFVSGDPSLDRLIDVGLRALPYGLLAAINLALLGLAGLAFFAALAQAFAPALMAVEGLPGTNWLAVAVACLLTALVACAPLLPAVRRGLARWLPIDPDSTVHTTALAFAVYQAGSSLGQMALIGDLENLADSTLALSVVDVLLTGVPLVLFALLGVGLFVRRGGHSTVERLGLLRPTAKQLAAAVGITLLLLALDLGVNQAWQALDPASYDLLDRVTDNLFGGLLTVGGALVLGLSAGISEELLFRGAVQPRLGLLLATLLFAIGHLQYGLSLATLEVFVIGLVLGLVRKRANTTVCILIHAAYNSVGTLLEML
jgi:hypothetical protein